jgi:hypothetical protein
VTASVTSASAPGIATRGAGVAGLPGIGAWADRAGVVDEMVERACSAGFDTWWRRAASVGFCAAPIQLAGTDVFGRERRMWVRCNNRRAAVCPSCSDLYARDTWQLVHAGCAGGHHDMPASIAWRPQVFVTLTAPSFGPVHSCMGRVCCDHQGIGGFRRCPHGKPLWCSRTHEDTDPRVGEPLCGECYDYAGHVLFSWHLPELWRRFTIALRRRLAVELRSSGGDPGSVRVSFVKVVEMQARAIPHIHALIRLDPTNFAGEPANADDSESWVPPLGASDLAVLVQQTARTVTLTVEHHGDQDGETVSRVIGFGSQLDIQPVIAKSAGAQDESTAPGVSGRRVSGYVAKYVTKSLHDFGISARRLSPEAICELAVSAHVRAILTTIAGLADHGVAGIGKWLHTLGYRGHITTKSRRYSTTLTALRAARVEWTRQRLSDMGHDRMVGDLTPQHDPAYPVPKDLPGGTGEGELGEVVWEFDQAAYMSAGDRVLVLSAARRHIDNRHLARENLRDTAHQSAWIDIENDWAAG